MRVLCVIQFSTTCATPTQLSVLEEIKKFTTTNSLEKRVSKLARLPFFLLITERRLVFCRYVKLMRRIGGWGVSDHPPILPAGLMYTAQVAFIGFTKGLMTGIMRVM